MASWLGAVPSRIVCIRSVRRLGNLRTTIQNTQGQHLFSLAGPLIRSRRSASTGAIASIFLLTRRAILYPAIVISGIGAAAGEVWHYVSCQSSFYLNNNTLAFWACLILFGFFLQSCLYFNNFSRIIVLSFYRFIFLIWNIQKNLTFSLEKTFQSLGQTANARIWTAPRNQWSFTRRCIWNSQIFCYSPPFVCSCSKYEYTD